jgi:hypothetical protein
VISVFRENYHSLLEYSQHALFTDFLHVDLLHMFLFIYLFIYFYYTYVHKRLGSFLPLAPTPSLTTHSAPSLSTPPPQYRAETILPLFLILL